MINISLRLKSIAEFVDEDKVLADVGCDHALLSIYLTETKSLKKIYAVDNKPGPLSRARENIHKYEKDNIIIPVLSDGFKKLKDTYYDEAIIAGMGGDTIIDILSDDSFNRTSSLILEPNKKSGLLRDFLHSINYKITDEKMVKDNDKIYFIIKAEPGMDVPYNETETEYGRINVLKEDILLNELIETRLNSMLSNLDKTKNNEELLNKISSLKEALNEIRRNNKEIQ